VVTLTQVWCYTQKSNATPDHQVSSPILYHPKTLKKTHTSRWLRLRSEWPYACLHQNIQLCLRKI